MRVFAIAAAVVLLTTPPPAPIDRVITDIAGRQGYEHAAIGVEAIDLASGHVVYAHNAGQFFVPGSTTKLLTIGSALAAFGADYRFHTRVYRTGDVDASGVLRGDVILVGSGDPNLSNRIRPDGTLAFENEDHSYGGAKVKPVTGDPLTIIDSLAAQVAQHGVRQIAGRVRVDVSLFPEGAREGGTGAVISPIVVNDNVVDVIVSGAAEGKAVAARAQPETAYVRFVNRLETGAATGQPDVRMRDVEESDGSHTVTLRGTMPAGTSGLFSWKVPQPSRFAAVALAERLQAHGIIAPAASKDAAFDPAAARANYRDDHLVAEHVSVPFSEAAKVVLKVSQNLHASMMLSVVGALIAPTAPGEPIQRGFDVMKHWLDSSGLDVSAASQGDGAGAEAHFTPHFMASYLAWMAKQPNADVFRRALPIMGRDGTLAEIEPRSPAAGHVLAKTGTYGEADRLHRSLMVDGKGLAGYIDTAAGRHLAFAAYINFVRVGLGQAQSVGDALGEIASAIYADAPRASTGR